MVSTSGRGNSLKNNAHGDSRKTYSNVGSLNKLSDDDLLKRLTKCRGAERAVLLKILRYLNEVERRRLYLPRGYGSLYDFCTDYLRYSRTAAWRRIHAARCIERFPLVAEHFLSGELTLTAVAMISGILTEGNADEIVSYVKGRSTRDVEVLVARHRPELMLRDRVRQISVMVPDLNKNGSSRFSGAGKNLSQVIDNKLDKNQGVSENPLGIEPVAAAPAGAPPDQVSGAGADNASDTARCEPGPEEVERVLITQRYKIEFAADTPFMEKLSRMRSFLSTKYPEGLSLAEVFDIAITEFLDRHGQEERIKRRNARRERKQRKHAPPGDENRRGTGGPGVDRRGEKKGGGDYGDTKTAGLNRGGIQPAGRDQRSIRPIGKDRRGMKTSGSCCEMRPTGKDRRCVDPPGGDSRGTGRNIVKRSRHIPQEIRDEVFARDGGRCAFVGDDGKRCGSDWNLEIDHIIPFARGGKNTPDNLRLLCAKHNRLAAEREYGSEFMKKYYHRA